MKKTVINPNGSVDCVHTHTLYIFLLSEITPHKEKNTGFASLQRMN